MRLNRRPGRIVRAAAAFALFLAASAGVRAQQAVVEEAGPLAQPIGSKTIEMFGTMLKLDADQKALAKTLYTGYRASYRKLATDGDSQIKALSEDDKQPHDRKSGFKVAREFVDKQDKLDKSFMGDLKAILTPEQAAGFERFERARRRETGLRFTFVSGEAVDLLKVISDLKVDRDGTPELKEATEQYELEADRAMVAKDKMLRELFQKIEQIEGPEADPKVMESVIKDFFSNGNRVRDLNRQNARRIQPLLPEAKRAAFEQEIRKLSFPRVYGESAAQGAIKAAQGLADLTADQKTELANVAEGYSKDAEGVNARWAAAIEDKQAKMSENFMEMMMGGRDEKPDDPLKLAREARKALDEKTFARVTQVLNAEQREKLPKVEKSGYERPEWEPNFDERGQWDEWQKEDGEAPPK